ncbi:MAG: hypothetical protein LBT39_01170, partial [Treponema sp.]|nr:hypothetical protein [Treponema sp.]
TAKGNNAVGGGVFMYAGVDSIIPGIFKKVTAAGDPSSSGTIYGNTGDANGNKVLNASDAVLNDRGHAVYVGRYDSGNYIVIKKRETTAGPTDSMDSTQTSAAGGWE